MNGDLLSLNSSTTNIYEQQKEITEKIQILRDIYQNQLLENKYQFSFIQLEKKITILKKLLIDIAVQINDIEQETFRFNS